MISLPARAVMKRELLSGLRNPRPFFFLGLFMILMILGLLFMVEVAFKQELSRVGTPPASLVSQLFMAFSMGLYLSAVLLIPPMAGVSICVEKQQDSYDLLLMSYIRPLQLALAKLSNVLGIYLLVVIASLPFVGVFFFLVGIDWQQFAISFALILLSSTSLAVTGLVASAWCYRTLPAIICTYVVGFCFHGGLIVMVVIFGDVVLRNPTISRILINLEIEIFYAMVPFFGLRMASDSFAGLDTIVYALLYHGAIVAIGLGLTTLILRRPARPMKVNQEKPIDNQAQLAARRRQFPYYLLDPRRRRPLIPDGQNPVLSKELQTGILSKGGLAVRLTYGFTIFSFFISLTSIPSFSYNRHAGEMVVWSLFLETLLILVVTPALVATSLPKEWEWNNIDSLRCTLLSPRTITTGKFKAALRTTSLLTCGAVLGNFGLLILAYDSLYFWVGAVVGLTFMVLCITYTLAVTFWAAAQCRNSLSGLLAGYAAAIVSLAIAPQWLMLCWSVIAGDFSFSRQERLLLYFASPLYTFYGIIDSVGRQSVLLLLGYGTANLLVFGGISAGLLWWTHRRFTSLLDTDRV